MVPKVPNANDSATLRWGPSGGRGPHGLQPPGRSRAQTAAFPGVSAWGPLGGLGTLASAPWSPPWIGRAARGILGDMDHELAFRLFREIVRGVVREELAALADAPPRARSTARAEAIDALVAAVAGILGASGETTAARLAKALPREPALREALAAMGYPSPTPHQVGLALASAARTPGTRLRRRHSNGTRWRVLPS